jgi:hypothetical protein
MEPCPHETTSSCTGDQDDNCPEDEAGEGANHGKSIAGFAHPAGTCCGRGHSRRSTRASVAVRCTDSSLSRGKGDRAASSLTEC